MRNIVIVNREHLIENSYFDDLKLVDCKSVLGEELKVEEETYKAYLKLKKFLESKNIYIGICSAWRSIREQQKIMDEYIEKYGIDYTNKYVAPVGASEHHTGLAIDLGIYESKDEYVDNDDLFRHEKQFLTIHPYLKYFGFILRYPIGKENITGYDYEPWHIRYVGKRMAFKITNSGLTLEEFALLYNNGVQCKRLVKK